MDYSGAFDLFEESMLDGVQLDQGQSMHNSNAGYKKVL